MLPPKTVRRLAQIVLIGLLAGCGPIQSTSVIIDAQAELAAATTANARDLAPFEYVAAEAYLHKAREEQSYADFQVSVEYGEKSLDCARVARMRAESAARESLGTTRPTKATAKKCLPGPHRANLPPADEEKEAGSGPKVSVKTPPPAPKRPGEPSDPKPGEPADPGPADPAPPQNKNLVEEPDVMPDGDAPLPEGDS